MDITPSRVVSESIQALSIQYNNLVYEKQVKGEDVIVLSLGEPFFDIPLFPFDSLPKTKINHYSHSRGIFEFRKKIVDYNSNMYGLNVDYEKEIIITAGSKIAIYMSLMSILNPGDEVIVQEPAWVSYPEQIKLCYGVPIQVPYNKTVYDFKDYLTKKTKMIIINNPHNPSGRIYSNEELMHVYDLARKNNLVVLSDEAYSDYVFEKNEFCSFGKLDSKKGSPKERTITSSPLTCFS